MSSTTKRGAARADLPELRDGLDRSVVRGFRAGLVATLAMSAAMLAAQRLGLMGTIPPRLVTRRILSAARVRHLTSERAEKVLSAVQHFAFGGAMGALFEVARAAAARANAGRTPRSRPATIVLGVAYATGIWAASYAGWIPKLSIMPAPAHDRPGRPTSMVLAHWIYGAVLARALTREDHTRERLPRRAAPRTTSARPADAPRGTHGAWSLSTRRSSTGARMPGARE